MSETQMVKNGRVEVGKTPAGDGKPCDKIVRGEPVRKGTKKEVSDFDKLASALDPS